MLDTDRKQQAIEITGVAPQTTIQMQFDRLRQEGILVDLNIAGAGMFQRTPNWAELGIPEFAGDRRASQFTKGSKYIFPEDKVKRLKSFESRLRQNLDRHSYDVTGFRPFRWLPYTAYQSWREKHDSLVAEARAFIEGDLIVNWTEYVDLMAGAYTEIAEAAWVSATTGLSDTGRRVQKYQYIKLWDKTRHEELTLDHDAFVDYIVGSVARQIPTPDEILAGLRFDYVTALVYGEQDIAADRAAAEDIRAQVSFNRRRADLENELLAEYDHRREQLQETVSPFAEVYGRP